jgi:hypothetical protein
MPRPLIPLAFLAALTVLAALARLPGLGEPLLWGDELHQRAVALENSFLDFLLWRHDPTYGNHAPLSFAISRLFHLLSTSDSPLAWRLPFALISLATIPLAYWAALPLFHPPSTTGSTRSHRCERSELPLRAPASYRCERQRATVEAEGLYRSGHRPPPLRAQRATVLTAALVALDPLQTELALSARMYSLLTFTSLLTLGLAFRFLPAPPTPTRAALLVLALIAAGWTHFLSAVLAPAMAAAVLYLAASRTLSRADAIRWLGLLALAFALSHIGLWRSLFFGFGQGTEIPPPTSFADKASFIRWTLGTLPWIPLPLANSLIYLFSAIGFLFLAWAKPAARPALLILALAAAATLLGQFYILTTHTFVTQRYLALLQPAFWLGLAALATVPRHRLPRLAGATLLAAYLAYQSWHVFHLDQTYDTIYHSRLDGRTLRKVAAAVAEQTRDNPSPITAPDSHGIIQMGLEAAGIHLTTGPTQPAIQIYHATSFTSPALAATFPAPTREQWTRENRRWIIIVPDRDSPILLPNSPPARAQANSEPIR